MSTNETTAVKKTKGAALTFKREQIKDFFGKYFSAYSTIAQDPEKIHQMSAFFAPDITVSVFLGEVVDSNFEEFIRLSSSHPSIQETLTPKHYIIDEAHGMIAALVKGVFTNSATGKVIREMDFSAHYQLKWDENGSIKIVHLWLFAQYAPDGEKNIFEMCLEDMMGGKP